MRLPEFSRLHRVRNSLESPPSATPRPKNLAPLRRKFLHRNPGVSFGNAMQALLILVVCGALAGLIPARRAVAISPVEALHSQ